MNEGYWRNMAVNPLQPQVLQISINAFFVKAGFLTIFEGRYPVIKYSRFLLPLNYLFSNLAQILL
jgi:hypothetical protein